MVKLISYLIFAGVAQIASSPAFAQQGQGPGYGSHMWNDGWHGMLFGPLMMILVLATVIVLAVLLVRWLQGSRDTAQHLPPGQLPLDILKERYARGEIDKEEFEERHRILGE